MAESRLGARTQSLLGRLRGQMMLLLALGLLVVDVVAFFGVRSIQAEQVDATLDLATDQIRSLPDQLTVRVQVVDTLAPSDLYVAYLGADDTLLTSSAPVSTEDTPDLGGLLGSGDLDGGGSLTRAAPGGTDYELRRVELPAGTRVQLEGGEVTRPLTSVVVGYPLAANQEALRRLVLLELVCAGLVLGAWFLVSTAFIRSGLRPLRRIGETAEAIAGGRTGERIPLVDRDAELRQVSSALNHAFDARQRSEDRMRDFVADASHELRTPVTAVRGWTDLYREGGIQDRAGIDAAMQSIFSEAGRMQELVEDMLLLARLEAVPAADQHLLTAQPLAPLLRDVVPAVAAMHPSHDFATPDPGDGLEVRCDPGSLRRALTNLLVNAARHTPPGTSVVVSVVDRGTTIEVWVEDDGPGMTAAERDAAFDRFWRGSGSRRTSGAGLGLAISRSILQGAGGDLRLEAVPAGGLAAVAILTPADEIRRTEQNP